MRAPTGGGGSGPGTRRLCLVCGLGRENPYERRHATGMSFKLIEPFDAMARKEADLTSSWEQLSPSATPRPSLQGASPGDLSSANEEDNESLPLLSRKIAKKRQGGVVCVCVRASVMLRVARALVDDASRERRAVGFAPRGANSAVERPLVGNHAHDRRADALRERGGRSVGRVQRRAFDDDVLRARRGVSDDSGCRVELRVRRRPVGDGDRRRRPAKRREERGVAASARAVAAAVAAAPVAADACAIAAAFAIAVARAIAAGVSAAHGEGLDQRRAAPGRPAQGGEAAGDRRGARARPRARNVDDAHRMIGAPPGECAKYSRSPPPSAPSLPRRRSSAPYGDAYGADDGQAPQRRRPR